MIKRKPLAQEIKALKKKEEKLNEELASAKEALLKLDRNEKILLSSNHMKAVNSGVKQLTQRNCIERKVVSTMPNATQQLLLHKTVTSNHSAIDTNKKATKPKTANKKAKCSSLVNVQCYLTERPNNPSQLVTNRLEKSIQRITEQSKQREEKKLQLKEKYLAEENKICNKTAKKVSQSEAEKVKAEFIERLKKTQEESNQRKKQEALEKKKKEEMILLREQTKKKKKKETILKQINEMFEWNEKKKDKIRLIKSQEDLKRDKLLQECFKPKICPNSKKIVQKQLNKSTESAFDRLFHDDEKRHQKREMLQSLYKPSFSPMVNKKRALNSINSRTITINDYCDLTINGDVEELLRNKVYQTRKNKAFETEHSGLPVLTEVTPVLNSSHISENSTGIKPVSTTRKVIKSDIKSYQVVNEISDYIEKSRECEITIINHKEDKAIKLEPEHNHNKPAEKKPGNASKDNTKKDKLNCIQTNRIASEKSSDSLKSESKSEKTGSSYYSKPNESRHSSKDSNQSYSSSESKSKSRNKSYSSDRSYYSSKSKRSSNSSQRSRISSLGSNSSTSKH